MGKEEILEKNCCRLEPLHRSVFILLSTACMGDSHLGNHAWVESPRRYMEQIPTYLFVWIPSLMIMTCSICNGGARSKWRGIHRWHLVNNMFLKRDLIKVLVFLLISTKDPKFFLIFVAVLIL